MLRRCGLAVAPRFLWECLNSRAVSRFPAQGRPLLQLRRVMGSPLLVTPYDATIFKTKECETSSVGLTEQLTSVQVEPASVVRTAIRWAWHGPFAEQKKYAERAREMHRGPVSIGTALGA